MFVWCFGFTSHSLEASYCLYRLHRILLNAVSSLQCHDRIRSGCLYFNVWAELLKLFIIICALVAVYGCLPVSSAQRSAQELPSVEQQDLDKCSVLGGQLMVLTGQNFTSDSRVVFSEKTQGKDDQSLTICCPNLHPRRPIHLSIINPSIHIRKLSRRPQKKLHSGSVCNQNFNNLLKVTCGKTELLKVLNHHLSWRARCIKNVHIYMNEQNSKN